MKGRKLVLSLSALTALSLTSCTGNTLEDVEDLMNRYCLQESLDVDYSTTVIKTKTKVKS